MSFSNMDEDEMSQNNFSENFNLYLVWPPGGDSNVSVENESHVWVVTDLHDSVFTSDDAAWALTCAFLILTMQTGFAMLEAGMVSSKNSANIMVKNLVDVSIGGISYWMFGFGLTFGPPSTPFIGLGNFFFHDDHIISMGNNYAKYFFQFSFASTATTIVSGAIAERMKLRAYMAFAFLNVLVYCIPACWAWGSKGWLRKMMFFDFAGVSVVHLNGGTSAFVAAMMLGPRHNRFENPENYEMSSPVTSLTGMFMLTWAWLGFNCGSTFGITGLRWKVSAVVAVTTLNGAIGGGLAGLTLSMIFNRGRIHIDFVLTSLLGGLVSVTGCCAVVSPSEALVIGACGASVAILVMLGLVKVKIDDPVGAVPVHFGAGWFGTLATGIFGHKLDKYIPGLNPLNGIFHGGGFRLFAVNLLGGLCISGWAALTTFLILLALKLTVGIRMSPEEELLGADHVEHNIIDVQKGLNEQEFSQLVSDLRKKLDTAGLGSAAETVRRLSKLLEADDVGGATLENGVSHRGSIAGLPAKRRRISSHSNPENDSVSPGKGVTDVMPLSVKGLSVKQRIRSMTEQIDPSGYPNMPRHDKENSEKT